MEKLWSEPGQISDLERIALKDEIKIKILELIGLDLKRMEELRIELELKEHELNKHLTFLERAMLLEREEGRYRLTPRCVAYMDQCQGYEWAR